MNHNRRGRLPRQKTSMSSKGVICDWRKILHIYTTDRKTLRRWLVGDLYMLNFTPVTNSVISFSQ